MPKYHIEASVCGTVYIGCFEADNEEEAIRKLPKGDLVGLCSQCASRLDLEIDNIYAEED
jgi:hypothetical protein